MRLWKSVSAALVSALRHPGLWLLQLFGNVIVGLLFVWWLNIGVANWWEIFLNVVVALIVFFLALLLHGGTMNYCAEVTDDKSAKLRPAFKRALRNLLAFAIWAFILHFVHALRHMDNYQYSFPGYLRSEFPAWLRRHVSEEGVRSLYQGILFLLRWIVIPGLLLPLGLLCIQKGFRGFISFREWGRMLRNLPYWIVIVLAALIGVYCGGLIVSDWRLNPQTSTLGGEESFAAFRLFFAYLLAIFSWLWVCFMLAKARPQHEPPPAESQKVAA